VHVEVDCSQYQCASITYSCLKIWRKRPYYKATIYWRHSTFRIY